MLRDRETWLTAFCYWVCLALLVFASMRRLQVSWLVVGALVVAAWPISVLLVIYELRRESEQARKRELLRSQGHFQDAASQRSDSFFRAGMLWGGSYMALALVLFVAGLVLVSPAALIGSLYLAAWGGWRLHRYSKWREEEMEHRRTSEQRITSATEALETRGWNASAPARTSASSPRSAPDDSF